MQFVLIPSGTFKMGSPPDELGRDDDEMQHVVTLSRPYYLQTTEVTNRQYRLWRAGHDSGAEKDGSFSLNGDDQPVVKVSWDDAMVFVAWLNMREPRRGYRLPTEAEWEYACRAGSSTPFWWGSSISTEQANYDGNRTYGKGPKGLIRRTTSAVRSFPDSPWGLYEVHGNAREWCLDWYSGKDYSSEPVVDPFGPDRPEAPAHVTRGGAFGGDSPYLLRAAYRAGIEGSVPREYVGFRIAASAP